MPENGQIYDRVFFLCDFPDHEGGESDGCDNRQRDDVVGCEPVLVLAFVHHDLQGTDPDDQQEQTDFVDGVFLQVFTVIVENDEEE